MDTVIDFCVRLFTQAPGCYLSWPAVGMLVGTLIGALSAADAQQLAVVPRTGRGLVGIITAPFVHANFSHLCANLPPFLVLGALMLRRGEARFVQAALLITLGQGVLLWLLGRKAAHVGMSGVVFGFFGYLLLLAFFTRATSDLLVAGGVLVFYGGMLAGLAPVRKGTSWEGHLFGLVAGLGTAWLLHQA